VLVEQLHIVGRRPHGVEVILDVGQLLGRDAGGRQAGGGGLEQPAHLGELEHGVATQQLHRTADAFQQDARLEAGHEGAVSAPHLEHPGGHQRADRLAHDVAADAQLRGELLLGRQPGARRELAGLDHLAEARHRLVGQRHSWVP
jgi:hypothetical protein